MNAAALPFVLLGGGGHAKVVLDLLRRLNHTVLGVCDPALAAEGLREWRGVAVLGGDEALHRYTPAEVRVANGLGSLPRGLGRRYLYESVRARGYAVPALIHPTAVLAEGVTLAEGVQVMAGVILQADAQIGENTLLNTGASVDHDCHIAAHCHIAPRAVLSGGVTVGEGCHVGVGATIIQGIRIGARSIVAAGTTVVRHLPADSLIKGQPAAPAQPEPSP